MNCLICAAPLGDPELHCSKLWHFACEACHFCKEPMPHPEKIAKQLSDGIPPSHDICRTQAAFRDFRDKKLPIETMHIQALNDAMVSFYPAMDPEAADTEILFQFLVKCQELTKNVSYILSLTKDKLAIKNKDHFNHFQEEKKRLEREKKFVEQTETIGKQERTAMFAAERDNPKLKARRKAVDGYVAMGLSREQAEAAVPQISTEKPN